MKILFIITRSDTVGGAQVHVRDLAKRLLDCGHDVLIVTGTPGPYTETLHQQEIPFFACDFLKQAIHPCKDWQTLIAFRQIIHQFHPDIVTTHSSKAGILGRLSSSLNSVPCLFTAHGWAFTEGVPQPKRLLYRLLEQIAEPLASQIICVSEHDRTIGLAVGMNQRRLLTIHNGIPDIHSSLLAKPGTGNPVRIVMIARFDAQKDHQTLLQACQALPEVHLDLVGDGPKLEETKALVQTLGLASRVNFLGFRQDVTDILAHAHIFALISHWEGFPLTTLEAMRAGLPVVVSDVGGAAEAVLDGETGYWVPRQNILTLRQRLSDLVENADLRSKMGYASRQRYEAEYTFELMFQRTFEVYKNLLATRGSN
ncbi:glycosyltransferase family 4 protein [Laspinema olomoucense]|uniref:glycosyltransferase family 4 protein n=1 Tax=Laspinema olomoucense TaxID=3231600 RepID=UPI0021BB704C|nr:glycosyltransferase family 4 protein [Laspinema sp. D3d]MCT7975685.1 glycosyltransferase family 4 protein [Laspinema sp. D3d]